MKKTIYIAIFFFLVTLIYFILTLSFDEPLLDEVNNNNWIGIGASTCGVLLGVIIKIYLSAKENIKKNRNKFSV